MANRVLLTARCLLPTASCRRIEVYYFGDTGECNLNDFAVCALNLNARRCQGLRSFHTTNYAPDTLAVGGYDLDVIFAVQGLKGRKGLGYFHVY